MHIDKILDLAKTEASEVIIPKSWGQGRTTFGGLSAALVYEKIRQHVDSERVLRSMTTNFVGPLYTDKAFTIDVKVIREGKNTSVVEARLKQDDKVALIILTCFGLHRDSNIRVDAQCPIEFRQAKRSSIPFHIPKLMPAFLKHISLDIVEGGMPYSGKDQSNYAGWMRFKKKPNKITDAHIITLIDAWPPSVLQMVKGIKPASTLSWNLEFIHPHAPLEADEWLAYKSYTRQAGDGYAHTEANVWNNKGDLIAISRQVVTIFD